MGSEHSLGSDHLGIFRVSQREGSLEARLLVTSWVKLENAVCLRLPIVI
jgi:hypothetical protein